MGYHIVWIPKYRKSILVYDFKDTVEKALLYKAQQLDVRIENYEIMPDHIHIFIKCNYHLFFLRMSIVSMIANLSLTPIDAVL